MKSFADYAAWYDAFNAGKDYDAEAAYILEKLKPWGATPRSWLDIGCGTGNHLASFSSRGIAVAGVDKSSTMAGQGRLAHPAIAFHVGLAQDFHVPGEWDVISMLFHVMSYQTSDDEIHAALGNVARHLGDGVFVFDFWHTAGVLQDPPAFRIRDVDVNGRRLYRLARPVEDRERRLVDVGYQFRWDGADGELAHQERHLMRHFSVDELQAFLSAAGLAMIDCTGWMRGAPPTERDWYGVVVARKKVAS
jgi:SAM-dependent methyltransferase